MKNPRPERDEAEARTWPEVEGEAILLGAPDRRCWLALADALLDWLDEGHDVSLSDLAYTLNSGQPSFPFRVGLVARSLDDLRDRLGWLSSRLSDPSCRTIRDSQGVYFGIGHTRERACDGPAKS